MLVLLLNPLDGCLDMECSLGMQGAMSEQCLELAQLHSDAVDFPKTGRKVELPQRLKPRRYPDFMQNKHK